MIYRRLSFITLLFLAPFISSAQTVSLIGMSEEFILENVKGYPKVEERGIEHEEFNVLVFEDNERELSFYFTFYRGAKVCNYIKSKGPLKSLKEDTDFIKSSFVKIKDDLWEKSDKTVQVQISEVEGVGVMIAKELRK